MINVIQYGAKRRDLIHIDYEQSLIFLRDSEVSKAHELAQKLCPTRRCEAFLSVYSVSCPLMGGNFHARSCCLLALLSQRKIGDCP